VEKVIWVPHGIYQDETDEHVDNMVAFVKPGVVAMAWTENKDDPQYAYCQATCAALKEAKDAKGRSLEIHKIVLPSQPLYMNEGDCKGLINNASTLDKRSAGRRLAASYINFYQGADFVILPSFGVKEDALAYRAIQALFPSKTIHQIPTREILLGGGNIHCITMQVPLKEE
jgi:agmatine deiminase